MLVILPDDAMKSSFSVFTASGTDLGQLENSRNTASVAFPFLNKETPGNPDNAGIIWAEKTYFPLVGQKSL